MDNQIELNKNKELATREFIDRVEELENTLLEIDHPAIAKWESDLFPLKHYFSNGIYVREMFISKDSLVIGRTYKEDHTWFLLIGQLEVITDDGLIEYVAPCHVQAIAGTKRVIKAIEDSVFINILPNPENLTDIYALEDMHMCKSYAEYLEYIKNKK